MSEWQPIETAPKDGTPVLLYGGEDDNAYYVEDKYASFTHAICRAAWLSDNWVMAFAEAGYVVVCYTNPTHWMPLPQPPETHA